MKNAFPISHSFTKLKPWNSKVTINEILIKKLNNMKHYITISVIAAAALASCTQTEDFTSQYNEKAKTMKFDVAYVGKNTRAATGELDTDGLASQKLILWCDAYQTSANPTTGIWISSQEPLYLSKSDATTYWNVYSNSDASTEAEVRYPGSTYTTYFTAIAPQDEFEAAPTSGATASKATYSMAYQLSSENPSSSPSFSTRLLTLDNIPVVQEVSNTTNDLKGIDYLITCAKSTSEEVSLPFKHLLSKLRFAVWTDENTMATAGSETTKIELNYLKVYLPKSVTAKYVQTKHDDVAGTWSWPGYTAPTEDNPNLTDSYQEYTLYNEGSENPSPKDVKYFAGPANAHESTNWDNVKLAPNFFIAPTGESTNVKIYIDIKYTVKRKMLDGTTWSSSSNSSDQGYHVGHKVVERHKMLVPINDSSNGHDNIDSDVDADRNEGLSHFHQGYLETLYICLRADQLVTFSTDFEVDNWENDPIDIKQ